MTQQQVADVNATADSGIGCSIGNTPPSRSPHWSRIDEISGVPVENYGTDLSVVLDKELIKNCVFLGLSTLLTTLR